MPPTPAPTQPSEKFASVVGLGAFKAEYPVSQSRWTSLILGILLTVVGPALAVIGIYVGATAYFDYGWRRIDNSGAYIWLIGGAIALVLGLLCLWEAWRRWPLIAALYENGFALNGHGGVTQIRWDQIEAVWQNVTRHYTNGIYTGTTHTYTIKTDTAKLSVDDKYQKVEELGQAIQRGAANALFPKYLQALKSGQRLSFGPLALDAQKLYSGKKELIWKEIKAIKIEKGYIHIKKEKGWFNWSTVTVPQVPNFFVFYTLIREFCKVE